MPGMNGEELAVPGEAAKPGSQPSAAKSTRDLSRKGSHSVELTGEIEQFLSGFRVRVCQADFLIFMGGRERGLRRVLC